MICSQFSIDISSNFSYEHFFFTNLIGRKCDTIETGKILLGVHPTILSSHNSLFIRTLCIIKHNHFDRILIDYYILLSIISTKKTDHTHVLWISMKGGGVLFWVWMVTLLYWSTKIYTLTNFNSHTFISKVAQLKILLVHNNKQKFYKTSILYSSNVSYSM